jgi:hypothetical protein
LLVRAVPHAEKTEPHEEMHADRRSHENGTAGNARVPTQRPVSTNGEIGQVATVNRSVGHVVEDLDGHELGYECK